MQFIFENLEPAKQPFEFEDYTYVSGRPMIYQWNGKTGGLYLITPGGESVPICDEKGFTILPLGWRKFKAGLFGRKERHWIEFFFPNEAGNICHVLFHDNSVRELENMAAFLEYQNLSIEEVSIRVRPKQVNGKDGPYYIAHFDAVEKIDFETLIPPPADLFRRDTQKEEAEEFSAYNVLLLE